MLPLPYPCEQEKLLSSHSTFGIGGPARYFAEVHSAQQMTSWIDFCHRSGLRHIVIGKGSNCLFADEGFDGLVLLNKIAFCHFEWPYVHAGAGYSFSLLGVQTARAGWSGLEFASGIPGSVGGAIYMNAGANGMETKNALVEVQFLDEANALQTYVCDPNDFKYRSSLFQGKQHAIISGKFLLHSSAEARKSQLKIVEYRTKTQPYGAASAGCVFRNPPGNSAGALIQQCGLKGQALGGAEVSAIHANFIINKSGARAADVLNLASHVQRVVQEQTGIALDMEIRYIPFRSDDAC